MTEKRNIHALIEKEAPNLHNILDQTQFLGCMNGLFFDSPKYQEYQKVFIQF